MQRRLSLAETTFVVVDIETTGSIPGKHAITEIGAVKVQQGRILERFESLVNPEQAIPHFIQQLTGITPDMVGRAPVIAEVMPRFQDFLGDAVFVAHHVPFDFRFLNRAAQILRGSELDNPQLCTCRLARKLLPNLKRKGLDAVSRHFNITIPHRHRALGDAEATALILIEFLKMLEGEGIQTLAKLLNYQQRGGKRYGDLKVPFPNHRLADFPQCPGVYFMRGEKGEILYIGKAKNLRKRLQSYFANLHRQPGKVQELMHQVFDIEIRILGSELEALLEESALIKQHQPYYNRQIKNYKAFPFLKIDTEEPYPRLSTTTEIDDEQALYFGPYQRKRHLAALSDSLSRIFQLRECSSGLFRKQQTLGSPCMAYEIGTCTAPCAAKVSMEEYRTQVFQVIAFLEGQASDATQRMVDLRERYSAELAFEKAGQVHDRLLELLKLQASTQYLAQAVHQNHRIILLPYREPSKNLILYIYKGRPLQKQVFDPDSDSVGLILERVQLLQEMLYASDSDGKREVIRQTELEEVRIIAHWLRCYQPDAGVKVWSLTQPYSELASEISLHFEVIRSNRLKSPRSQLRKINL